MGVMLSAAGSLRWFRDTLAPGVDFADLVAKSSNSGGRRRLTLPLPDRRAHAHPKSAGARRVVGLTVRHTRRPLRRAPC